MMGLSSTGLFSNSRSNPCQEAYVCPRVLTQGSGQKAPQNSSYYWVSLVLTYKTRKFSPYISHPGVHPALGQACDHPKT